MSSRPDNPDVSRQKDDSRNRRSIEEKELDRIADKAAERAGREEEDYDEEHNIFTN